MNREPTATTVFVSQGPLGAEVAKAKLEREGITTVLRYESIGRVLGLTVDGLGAVEVQVRPEDEERAREILSENDEPPPVARQEGAA